MNNTITAPYPKIILSEKNPEIQDCNLFHALVGLYADFLLKDGTHFPYADVTKYADGVFHLLVGEHAYSVGYTVNVPVELVDTITYI